uniref:Uncharacterized protein n=1 Tax=Anguilla anguilla TaxID=7936 RepID=A0A0E9QL71_ANGAN
MLRAVRAYSKGCVLRGPLECHAWRFVKQQDFNKVEHVIVNCIPLLKKQHVTGEAVISGTKGIVKW